MIQPRTDDDRAVSPVIGVILMVAITVILAAVIASFVLGLGDTDDPAPNIVFEDSVNDAGELEISISSGDADADASLLNIYVNGEDNQTWENPKESDNDGVFSDDTGSDDLSAGQQVVVDDDGLEEGDEIEFIWEDNGTSEVIGEVTIPSGYGPED